MSKPKKPENRRKVQRQREATPGRSKFTGKIRKQCRDEVEREAARSPAPQERLTEAGAEQRVERETNKSIRSGA